MDVHRHIKPDVTFLSESHLDKIKAEKLMRKMNYDKCLVHDSDGRSGGLILMWKKEIKIVCRRVENFFIDVLVKGEQDWRFTGFYGEPSWENKYKSWEYIRELHAEDNLPWLIIGDFNEILFSWEKEGGAPRATRYMKAFQDCLTDCGLENLGYVGDIYTWRRDGLRERLDRAVANATWNSLFPHAKAITGENTKSDHRPVTVNTEYLSDVHVPSNLPKHFEARWL
jgi:hypothetical protein